MTNKALANFTSMAVDGKLDFEDPEVATYRKGQYKWTTDMKSLSPRGQHAEFGKAILGGSLLSLICEQNQPGNQPGLLVGEVSEKVIVCSRCKNDDGVTLYVTAPSRELQCSPDESVYQHYLNIRVYFLIF